MQNLPSNKVALGGIFSALSFVFLFLAGIIPGIELTLYAVASVFPALMILECGREALKAGKEPSAGPGILVYIVTVILGIFIMPNKLAIMPYALFFGIYGIIKYYIEKFNHPIMRNGIKVIVFAVLFTIGYLGFREICFSNITIPEMAFPVLLIIAIIMLMLYDFIFSYGIGYYLRKVHGGKIQ